MLVLQLSGEVTRNPNFALQECQDLRRRVYYPLPAQMDAGRRRIEIAPSRPANGPRGAGQGLPGHVAITENRRHLKRRCQPELVQGCCTGPSREGGHLRACKHPLKTSAKQRVFQAKIVAHAFKCSVGSTAQGSRRKCDISV
jgi:hypothetical protein